MDLHKKNLIEISFNLKTKSYRLLEMVMVMVCSQGGVQFV